MMIELTVNGEVGRLRPLARCRGCGAEIAFIKTVKGKTMPVDPESVYFTPSGGPETFVTMSGDVVRGARRKNGAVIGFISHFATCPAADSFRKGRHKGK